ncbi:carboxypeptidase-like regulatory domain-containing protein [Sulfurimonas sp. SWIR-19]|uniref:TonB-dependent receptor domain-containing protein n=1 Tax=Sulfurimonas sp. SWIR-19 TaxID=2878390 RepID=UPI001CF12542|nr:TonB-dependent receptor [Sulfurimonas sp. SWIR-19]UCM99703.1 carboxypeptidase-like regulatory domain-containing protein [Sulfurimonas sp. SWIR-19]
MKQLFKILLITLCSIGSLYAEDTGSASVFSFLNGMPLENNEILVDGKYKYYTDEDGSVEIVLETGKHQIEIFAKDDQGHNLGYTKKTVIIKDSRDTQLIATFKENSAVPYVEIDTPVGDTNSIVAKNFAILQGSVLSEEDGKGVANARIFVKGTAIDARTDENGSFSIAIPADTNLSISIVHSEYSAQTLNNIRVKKDKTHKVTVKLTPASMELEEFIVLAPQVKGSIAATMNEEKNANAITNIVGNEQIARQGDSDAAGALKRITGVTIVDGSDVYVRGLGGRYSNVEMNSMPLPSPDPQRRTVPLDIFPAAVIGSMQVQKSATADIPASFGGGYVNIRTKEQAKENYFRITTELKMNSYTGKKVANYEGSSTDWMGYDNGYRAIPSDILNDSKIVVGERVPSFDPANNAEYMQQITQRSFNITPQALAPGGKVSIEGAYNQDIASRGHIAVFANYSYGQDHTYREEKYYNYNYNQATDTLYETPNQEGDVYKTVDQYKNSAILNVHYNYANVLNLKFTQLYSKISEKVTKITDGVAGSNDDWRITYDLNWEERTLLASQFSGDMLYSVVDLKNKFSFGAEITQALLDQPSNYRYTYFRNIGLDGVQIGDPYLDRYAPNVFLNLTTNDDLMAFYLKNRTEFELLSKDDYLEIGWSNSAKTRESRYNKYRVNQSSNAGRLTEDIDTIYNKYLDDFSLDISFQPAYWYDAEVDETSTYANLFLKPTKKTELLVGARSTDFQQTVYQYTNFNNLFIPIEKVPENLSFNSILPSMTFKYIFDKKNQINFAYSQTYIVPDLREFTDTEYFHPYDIATVKGNPDLKNTDITNYDLRFSHYFSSTENVTFGTFYKYLDKPIEDVLLPTSSLPRYSYANADYATLYGIELDGRKNLDFIANSFKRWYFSGNFSYTKSEVNLTPQQQELYTTNKRELQGLSPTVVNVTVGYEKKDRSVTLSYNKMGERIRKVGMIDAGERYPDHYEVPPQIVDFVWIEKFKNHIALRLRLKNLLDEETIWYQGSRSNVTKRFRTGRFYSFSFSYKY